MIIRKPARKLEAHRRVFRSLMPTPCTRQLTYQGAWSWSMV